VHRKFKNLIPFPPPPTMYQNLLLDNHNKKKMEMDAVERKIAPSCEI
jgi:hypothetical protein